MADVSLKSIAKQLNLSISTVSRALHNHPDISKETKNRVLNLASELDYHINSIAQGLKKKRTNTIGVIVPEIKHDFFAEVISGIEEITYNAGFAIVVCESDEDVNREILNTRALASNRVAGLLVSVSQSTTDCNHFKLLQKKGIPIVFFDRVIDNIEVSKVLVDDYKGAFQIVEYLIQSGYRRIAHIAGPDNISISRERLQGYKEALQQYDYPIDETLIKFGGLNEQDGAKAIRSLLNLEILPDAVFAVNDPTAFGAYEVIKKQELRIPEDIAIVGFSNSRLSAYIQPKLTTVDQPGYEVGITAAKLLLDHINAIESNEVFPSRTEIVNTKLIIRQSA